MVLMYPYVRSYGHTYHHFPPHGLLACNVQAFFGDAFTLASRLKKIPLGALQHTHTHTLMVVCVCVQMCVRKRGKRRHDGELWKPAHTQSSIIIGSCLRARVARGRGLGPRAATEYSAYCNLIRRKSYRDMLPCLVVLGWLTRAFALCHVPIGTAIERATSASEVLHAAARITPPGPEFESPHLAQDVHQVKRQQLASNALVQLRRLLTGSGKREERDCALVDARLAHTVRCAAAPSSARADGVDLGADQQSARVIARSLESLGTVCAAGATDASGTGVRRVEVLQPLREEAELLARRAEGLAGSLGLAGTHIHAEGLAGHLGLAGTRACVCTRTHACVNVCMRVRTHARTCMRVHAHGVRRPRRHSPGVWAVPCLHLYMHVHTHTYACRQSARAWVAE